LKRIGSDEQCCLCLPRMPHRFHQQQVALSLVLTCRRPGFMSNSSRCNLSPTSSILQLSRIYGSTSSSGFTVVRWTSVELFRVLIRRHIYRNDSGSARVARPTRQGRTTDYTAVLVSLKYQQSSLQTLRVRYRACLRPNCTVMTELALGRALIDIECLNLN
jgi:hypothetical protein